MANKIIMPKQGLQMERGTVTKWLRREGDRVTEGEPLFEIETDKLTITIDASAGGTLLKILCGEGEEAPVAAAIAIVGEPGEDISALLRETGYTENAEAPAAEPAAKVGTDQTDPVASREDTGGRIFISPRAKRIAEEKGIDYRLIPGSGDQGMIIERDLIAYEAGRPSITPLAAKTAEVRGISLSGVKGSGAGGKITVADLPSENAPASAAPAPSPSRGVRTEPMNGMRKAIARNMLASKEANAQASHRVVVDMTEVIALREAYKAQSVKVSYNDIIIRVCAQVLKEMPIINASVDGNSIVYHDYVNIGLAVSVPGGLIVPVVKDADTLGVKDISAKTRQLVDKAHNGSLTDSEYHGGTFTVTSLGMYDVDDFVAIINPPESAILAVGKICRTPVVVTGRDGKEEIGIRPMCALNLSYDHRIIDGAEAAKFLQKVKSYLQNPMLML